MYEQFYNLREKPFSLLPDPSYLYLSKGHRMALTMLQYSLMNQAGFCVITGEIGAGKTTLIRRVLDEVGDDVTVGLISNTHPSFGRLMQWVLSAFDLDYKRKEKVEMHDTFVEHLLSEYARGRHSVLIIDEAQNLSPESLEELRLLSNVNTEKDLLLQMILVGQPELREMLALPKLRQFTQRISANYHLNALNKSETLEYIRHRLRVAGGDPDIFEDRAGALVWYHSRGVPRLINTICDTSLVYGFAEQQEKIDFGLVSDVVRDRLVGGVFASESDKPGQGEAAPTLSVKKA